MEGHHGVITGCQRGRGPAVQGGDRSELVAGRLWGQHPAVSHVGPALGRVRARLAPCGRCLGIPHRCE